MQQETDDPQTADGENIIAVTICTMTEKLHDFPINNTTTVKMLKATLTQREGASVQQACLIFEGRQLIEEDRVLVSYNVRRESCFIFMILNVPFCPLHLALPPFRSKYPVIWRWT